MRLSEERGYKIASPARQILILMWKNMVSTRRNIVGSLLEFVCPVIFISFLLVIRSFIEKLRFTSQFNMPRSILDLRFGAFNQTRNLVLYYPNTQLVRQLVQDAIVYFGQSNQGFNPVVTSSDTPSGFELSQSLLSRLLVFYSFPADYNSTSLPDNVEYTIYTQEDQIFKYKTDSIFPQRQVYQYDKAPEDLCYDPTYFNLYNIFNAFKYALDIQIIRNLTGVQIENRNLLKIAQYKCPDYTQDEFMSTFSFFIPVLVSVSFMVSCVLVIGNFVHEKETKMREYLKLVGIKWYTLWLSWWMRLVGNLTLWSLIVAIVAKLTLHTDVPPVSLLVSEKRILENTNFFIIFIFLNTYATQVSVFSLLVAQFFNKPFNARVVLLVIWVCTLVNLYNYFPSSVFKYLLSGFPNLALIFGFEVIFQFERSGRELSFGQMYTNLFNDPLNLGSILIAMNVWCVFYFALIWYLEKILPGQYGVALPFYFIFSKSYWFPQTTLSFDQLDEYSSRNRSSFEDDPVSLRKTVVVRNLSKSFKKFRQVKKAVSNVSINFYENQITGLLGHNGAGKTTTTFLLCGLYQPTSGTAYLMGHDLRSELDRIRSIIGYCPQQDILFDNFLVEEHLRLIALIKGFPIEKLKAETDRIATYVGLEKDLTKKAKELSGGMKRRLMVGMALMGDSKIIILDEPTSGLDPFNRVKLWDLIRRYKTGRTIILTTHFMEEADALSDRIAIMNHGEIKCCGSPLFLKNYYGDGFKIKFYKAKSFDLEQFERMLRDSLGNYTIESNVAAELSISYPFENVQYLSQFFNLLERNKEFYGIDSYSISSSSIEEVFLKVGKLNQDDVDSSPAAAINQQVFKDLNQHIEFKKGLSLYLQQTQALLYKRFVIFIRRFILAFTIIVLPIVATIMICIILRPSLILDDPSLMSSARTRSKRLLFDINSYGSQEIPVFVSNFNPLDPVQQMLQRFYSYSRRPKINLIKPVTQTISDFVFSKHNSSLNSLVSQYFFGYQWTVPLDNAQMMNVNSYDITLYYSRLAYHTSAIGVHEISNMLLTLLNENQLNKSINTYNYPIPPTGKDSTYYGDDFLKYLGCFDILPLSLFNMAVALLYAFVISLNVMHVAKEKQNESKQLQLLSNTSYFIYWLSNYLFDFALCLLNISLFVAILAVISKIRDDPELDIYLLSSSPTVGYLYLVLFISALNWPLLSYWWLHFFKSDVTGFVVLLIFLGTGAFIDLVLSFIQIFIHITDEGLVFEAGSSIILYFLRLVVCVLCPNVAIKRILFDFRLKSSQYCISTLNRLLKVEYQANESFLSFAEPGIGLLISILLFQLGFSILFLIAIETNSLNLDFFKSLYTKVFKRPRVHASMANSSEKIIDSDVLYEQGRINKANLLSLSRSEPLIIDKLVKRFFKKRSTFTAVDNLSFGVESQRCFGLLGLNGAGKTTTFKMIIGELKPDQGDVLVNGRSIRGNKQQVRKNLGYCPQFDRLPTYMTVNETLYMYAKLRGIKPNMVGSVCRNMVEMFQLNEFEHAQVQNLSGGNKRKVSCAIAFIGKPDVIILDEPSTGMDPGARKFLWNIIKRAKESGMTMILSSHSMEECEALCDKLAIMISGQLECFGPIQNLKDKFGNGYRLILKLNHSVDLERLVDNVNEFVMRNFPTAGMEDRQYETLFYIIKTNNEADLSISLSRIFSLIEANKRSLQIESYSLSQSTLEQIFMSFANKSTSMSVRNDASLRERLTNKRRARVSMLTKVIEAREAIKKRMPRFGSVRRVVQHKSEEIYAISYKTINSMTHCNSSETKRNDFYF